MQDFGNHHTPYNPMFHTGRGQNSDVTPPDQRGKCTAKQHNDDDREPCTYLSSEFDWITNVRVKASNSKYVTGGIH